MRLLVAGLTVIFVLGFEMTAYPAADASYSIQTASLTDESPSAFQSVALAKADRLVPAVRLGAQPALALDVAGDEVLIDLPKPAMSTGEFCEALAQAAAESNIPPAFFARLLWQESKFKHDAMSHVGAQGVAQFMPATAAEVGLDDPLDPRQALPASARFLRKLHDRFGNLGLAAAAYNAGPGRIQNWLARRGPLPEETRNYVRVITGNAAETWTSERKTVGLDLQLPGKAPCEGVGGLSRDSRVAKIPVALTPVMAEIVRKARIEAARAAAAAKKLRLAMKKGKGKALDKAKTEKLIIAVKKSDGRVRVASAAK
jgi:CheY-like chemotaxis protein